MLNALQKTGRQAQAACGKAFTLVELLTVIAVLGLLSGILVAALGNMRDKGREADSSSRLRQVYMLQMLYAQEHKQRMTPFFRNDDTGTNQRTWQELLLPYVNRLSVAGAAEDPQSVLNSPYQTRTEGVAYWSQGRSFGLNNYMAHSQWRYYVSRILNPSKVVLAGDMVQGNVDFVNTSDGANWYSSGGLSWGLPAYRHSGGRKAMFVFCDGHVELLDAGELAVNPSGGRGSVWKWW
jgi:prepilin-type processing-associated H-X9-DG protein/prepilin-type N-terminal cleavage/methylation domain-containing protein